MPAKKAKAAELKKGRVRPTLQAKGIAINDDSGLERGADAMGVRASATGVRASKPAEPIWWRVSVIKKKMVYLGRVQAVDKAAAMVEVNKEFASLADHERARLVIEKG
jgi:hypothetical protein